MDDDFATSRVNDGPLVNEMGLSRRQLLGPIVIVNRSELGGDVLMIQKDDCIPTLRDIGTSENDPPDGEHSFLPSPLDERLVQSCLWLLDLSSTYVATNSLLTFLDAMPNVDHDKAGGWWCWAYRDILQHST